MSADTQPVIITVEGRHYDINSQSEDVKEHYVECVNLKKEMQELQAQINMGVQRLRTLDMALSERRRLLEVSISNDKNDTETNDEAIEDCDKH